MEYFLVIEKHHFLHCPLTFLGEVLETLSSLEAPGHPSGASSVMYRQLLCCCAAKALGAAAAISMDHDSPSKGTEPSPGQLPVLGCLRKDSEGSAEHHPPLTVQKRDEV